MSYLDIGKIIPYLGWLAEERTKDVPEERKL
jgi:hypothetical protein